MPFWTRRKTAKESTPAADTGKVQPAKKKPKTGPPSPLEVKLLAVEALEAGLSASQVAEIVGVTETTISAWRKQYREGGLKGLYPKPGPGKVKKACSKLEERIVAHRQENPDHGVRRIRDDLRRDEGLAVSAEKVRQTVNAAGTLVWQRGIGTIERDDGVCVAVDPAGGFMVGGKTWGFDPVIAGYLVKVDSAGDVQWSQIIEGMSGINDMARTDNGDWILAGQGGTSGRVACLTRVDAMGTVLWQRLEGNGLEGGLGSVLVLEDGTIFTSGNYGGGSGLEILLSGSGDPIWKRSDSVPGGLAINDRDGGFLILGHQRVSYTDIYMNFLKMDPAGDTLWRSRPDIEGSFQDSGCAVIPHPGGGYLVAGTIWTTVIDGNRDIFLTRLDGRGHLVQRP